MARTVQNIAIEPMTVTFGTDVAQVATVTTRADVASDLQNKYFYLYSPTVKYHVWFNVASGGVDPNPGGSTAIAVAISSGATASAVASAVQSAVDALAAFVASVNQNVVTITNAVVGYAPGPHEGVGTSFSFAVSTMGNTAAEVGYVDGSVELSMSEDLVDVTAEQTGSNVLSQIRTGKQVELKISLKETSKAQLKAAFVAGGMGSFTPAGASGTEVVGYGTYQDFTQTLVQANKLVLHPIKLAASDKSGDYTFHKAYPIIESLAFSGEEILMLPLTFKCYPDLTLNDRVEFFAYGDGSQTLT